MEQYDPAVPPEPSEWLELDEATRIEWVLAYHERSDENLENADMHALVHVVVENQVALSVDPVPDTLERLIRDGLDRHEALHAVGAILAEDIFDLLSAKGGPRESPKYRARLGKLTAKRWRGGKW